MAFVRIPHPGMREPGPVVSGNDRIRQFSNLYAAHFVPTHLDPTGNITVKVAYKTPYECGDYSAGFDGSLEAPSPCDGYIVQRVVRSTKMRKCCEQSSDPKTEEFFEILKEVSRGELADFTDESIVFDIGEERIGEHLAQGTIRLVCKNAGDPEYRRAQVVPKSANWDTAAPGGEREGYRSVMSRWACCPSVKQSDLVVTAGP